MSKKKNNYRPKTAGLLDRGRGLAKRYNGRGQSRSCDNEGHDTAGKENTDKEGSHQLQNVAVCILLDKGLHECCVVDSCVPLKCGHDLPLLSAACKDGNCQWIADNVMPVDTGYVGKFKVNVLRDSGCSTAVGKRSLVEPDQLTGQYRHCVLIDGTVKKVEVANIYVNIPFYVGQLEALCMENPIYELIIGNVHGVINAYDINKNNIRECQIYTDVRVDTV